MNPRMTALVDQAAAAAADAARLVRRIAEQTGAEIRSGGGPAAAAISAQLVERLLADQITLCPHLTLTSPQPAHWLAYVPDRLRCAPCAADAADLIKGTHEDRRCDLCQQIWPPQFHPIHASMATLAPVVIAEPGNPRCVPPVAIHFGLCHLCHVEDQLARGEPENEATNG